MKWSETDDKSQDGQEVDRDRRDDVEDTSLRPSTRLKKAL